MFEDAVVAAVAGTVGVAAVGLVVEGIVEVAVGVVEGDGIVSASVSELGHGPGFACLFVIAVGAKYVIVVLDAVAEKRSSFSVSLFFAELS